MSVRPATVAPAERPAGYPVSFERRLDLPDGRHAFVRPVVPADVGAFADALAAADADTLYRRFFSAVPNLGPHRLRYLTEVDYVSRMALVALDPAGNGIAVARYEGSATSPAAEVAVVVDPGWRRAGLASRLLAMLAEAAAAAGVTGLDALVLADNQPALTLFEQAGYAVVGAADGVVTMNRELPARPN